jgi:ubiquinone/menaquinone biosynthesis C-methylase UbiE
MQDHLRTQYRDDKNLNTRIQLHVLYSTNPLLWQQWIFAQFQLTFEATILELGCGPGTLWMENEACVPAGWEITLTDFSEGMLESARKNLQESHHNYHFNQVDAQEIPFKAQSFDAVIANHMLYHVPDRSQALSEIKRVLKKRGTLYATTIGKQHMVEVWALVHPFAPHLVERRSGATTMNFTLENGARQLAEVFHDVKRVDYEDSLEVTDADAVIAYLRSSTTLVDLPFTDVLTTYVRDRIQAAIDERGAFHVTKASGMFIAS